MRAYWHLATVVSIGLTCWPSTILAQDAIEIETEPLPAATREAEAAAPTAELDQFLLLAEAYQHGYFTVVAVAAMELYSTAGIIHSDFDSGVIDAEIALDTLAQSMLLHSACTSTITSIWELTPVTDTVASGELKDLARVLALLGDMQGAMVDWLTSPGDETSQAMEDARLDAIDALDNYITERESQ